MNSSIDWKNHFIAFFSSLFGILIAFQLEEYREDKRENEELRNSLIAVRQEIEHNLQIYKENSENLGDWLDYFALLNQQNNEIIEILKSRFEELKMNTPDRVSSWKVLSENDSVVTLKVNQDFVIDVLPSTGISVSSWQAAIYSGTINKLSNQVLNNLTKIYEWIEKDLNTSDQELLEQSLFSQFDDIDLLQDYYTRVQRVHSFKYNRIKDLYDQMNWQ